ncbi:hypothetical protein [Afifella sp. IM 167]|uniref:pyroglutamyl-peptidase I family protein n=1 Tax=Afifella sp. IM 167 TaxID=2033586 RepID=UPI001CCF5CF8|nr:hypothetical protein [Afifella sp. IM 167]MBZ8132827.1 hypothetical protein [Afifella sp. IM 167]
MRRPRLLVTGFGPFPGVPENPSGWLMERLSLPDGLKGIAAEARFAVLPTDWQAGPAAFEALWQAHSPDIAVQFGVSRRARGFELERLARNRAEPALADAAGKAAPSCRVDPEGPETWRGSLPIRRIRNALEAAGHPAGLSDDAGLYLCNALYYRAGRLASQAGRLSMNGFVHLPFLEGQTPPAATERPEAETAPAFAMAHEAMAAGARLILEVAVEAWRERAEEAA